MDLAVTDDTCSLWNSVNRGTDGWLDRLTELMRSKEFKPCFEKKYMKGFLKIHEGVFENDTPC
jgi:hypothetical protein